MNIKLLFFIPVILVFSPVFALYLLVTGRIKKASRKNRKDLNGLLHDLMPEINLFLLIIEVLTPIIYGSILVSYIINIIKY